MLAFHEFPWWGYNNQSISAQVRRSPRRSFKKKSGMLTLQQTACTEILKSMQTHHQLLTEPLPPRVLQQALQIWTTTDLPTWENWAVKQLQPITLNTFLEASSDFDTDTFTINRLGYIMTVIPIRSRYIRWSGDEDEPWQLAYNISRHNHVLTTTYTVSMAIGDLSHLCAECAHLLTVTNRISRTPPKKEQFERNITYTNIIPEVITNIFYEYCRLCRVKPLYTISPTEPPAVAA